MRHDLNGIKVNLKDGDFGGILDWFSSPKKISKEEQIRLGQSWINSVYNELKPNATYQTFIEALKLDSYNQKIPEEDYRDFLATIGFNVNENKTISDKVKSAVVSSLRNNKNGLPSRRSIISAFLNPNNIRITFWDASKVVASSAAKDVKEFTGDVASVASGTFSIIGFIAKYRVPIIITAAGLAAWFFYSKREVVKERISEKILGSVGLSTRTNPKNKKRKRISKDIKTYIKEGYPQKQAVAIAYSKERKRAKAKRKKA